MTDKNLTENKAKLEDLLENSKYSELKEAAEKAKVKEQKDAVDLIKAIVNVLDIDINKHFKKKPQRTSNKTYINIKTGEKWHGLGRRPADFDTNWKLES